MHGITGRTLTVASRMTGPTWRRLTRVRLICRRLGRTGGVRKPGMVWLMRG